MIVEPRGTLTGVLAAWWLAAAIEGRPLYYWGARVPVVTAAATTLDETRADVTEVHAALDADDLVLRFTFDRGVGEALRLPDGAPVSGRLHAVLEVDADDDRATGLNLGAQDLKTGADRRIEIGTRYLGGDEDEHRAPSVQVTAALFSLSREGRRRMLWHEDDVSAPSRVSWHGDALEVRIPAKHFDLAPHARFILSRGDRTSDGRI
jgi:hypothetical protein